MTPLPILTVGHPALRERARELTPDELQDPDTQRFIDALIETMRDAGGAGLAATQVGDPRRVAVIEVVPDHPRYPYKPPIPLTVIVNPQIEFLDEETFAVNEGCLSIPNLRGEVPRAINISVRSLDREGAPHEDVYRGLTAGTFQHEVNHLDGILFLDRVGPIKRRRLLADYKRSRKGEAGYLKDVVPEGAAKTY